jgi:hypothetical protein
LPHHGSDYWDKVEQVGSEAAEKGQGDPVKTIKAIRCLLENLGADAEVNRRKTQAQLDIPKL